MSDYNFLDKIIHKFALSMPFISEMMFDLDGIIPGVVTERVNERHVFICGLARSGTTILMRAFYQTGKFRSLTYRDMPFLLMPRTWGKIAPYFYSQMDLKLRAHADGICVNFDSPEAFEEVFWRTFTGKQYIYNDCLKSYVANNESIDNFRIYVNRITSCSGIESPQRYLSKNNNNILRLSSIRKALPQALIVIPFRDPLQHAISLLKQHQLFCTMHSQDKFSLDYMNWLVHHEFGAEHLPFRFNENESIALKYYKLNSINYWISIWINAYLYCLDSAPIGSIFISFEELCKSPAEILSPLFNAADLEHDVEAWNALINEPKMKQGEGVDEKLYKQSLQIYQDLCSRSKLSRISSV